MSYNRPDYVSDALNSIVNQTIDNSLYKIIVSDNSSNEEGIFKVIEEHKDIFHYIKRTPSIDVISHHKKLIEENTTKYFMMFHDDDIMMPTMLESLLDKIKTNNYAAVGCNAFELRGSVKTNKLYNKTNNNIVFKKKSSFIINYLLGNGVHPFPGYLYRKSSYCYNNMDIINGGRFSDVLFVASGIDDKPIYCFGCPKMFYRTRKSVYSKGDFVSKLKFISSVNKISNLNIKKNVIDIFRIRNIFNYLWSTRKYKMIYSNLFIKTIFYNKSISIRIFYNFLENSFLNNKRHLE